MRHNKKINHLGRQHGHREAMLSNMATSLIVHKRINTTLAKAKALRMYVEPIITMSRNDTTHARRTAFSYLRDKNAVTELFRVVSPAVGDRPGGYTRILKTGFRLGDAAEMCFIELVDFNETYGKESAITSKSRTRRGRGGAKKTNEQVEASGQSLDGEPMEDGSTDTSHSKAAAKKKTGETKTRSVTAASGARKISGAKTVARKTAASKKT